MVYRTTKTVNFVEEYMYVLEHHIDLFEKDSFGLKSDDERYTRAYDKMIESVSDFRYSEEVKEYLESEGFGSYWLDIVTKNKTATLSKVVNELYGSEKLPSSINKDTLINTLFFKTANFDKEILDKYINKINDFTLDKDITTLYNFDFLSNNESNFVHNDDSNIKKHLTNIFKSLEKKDRSEIIFSLNIFIEIYENTDFGSKHILLINNEYKKELEKGNKDAQINWLNNILDTASSCSPSKIYNYIECSENNKKVKMIKKVENEGRIDGLFFINSTKYGDESLKKLNSVKSLKELKSFKQEYKKKEKIIIFSISDKSIDFDQDTIVRHPLANIFLSKLLNSEMKRYDYFISNFNNNLEGAFKDGNVNIRNSIVKAFKNIDSNNEVPDGENDEYSEEDYNIIQSKILKNPVKYINEDINRNIKSINENRARNGEEILPTVKRMTLLTKEYFNEYIKLHKEDGVFDSHSYVCFFQKGNVHKSGKLEEKDVTIEKIKRLDKEDKVALIQYAALVKAVIFKEDTEISIDLCNDFSDLCLNLRCFSDKKILRNDLFDEIKTNDIDAYVLETFILSEHFEKNKEFLDDNLKKNTSKIIVHVLREYNEYGEDAFLSKYNIAPEKLFNGIEFILENYLNVFHQYLKSEIKVSFSISQVLNQKGNVENIAKIISDILKKKCRTFEDLNIKEKAFLKRINELVFDIFDVKPNDLFKDKVVLNILKMSELDVSNESHYEETEI